MITKVGLVKGISQYNVIRAWSLELEKGLEKLGIETVVFDLKYHDNFNVDDDIDCFIGFSGWGVEKFTQFKQPFIMIMADQVLEHTDEIKKLRSNDILFVMDRHDMEILKLIELSVKTYFLPHAAIEIVSRDFVEKNIDCLFLGSYSDPNNYLEELNNIQPDYIKAYIEKLLNNIEKSKNTHHAKYILNQFKQSGVTINSYENEIMLTIINVVGRYLYPKKRLELLLELANGNINVEVYGNGWENSILVNYPNLTFHKAVHFYEAQKIIQQAKITINMQPFLVDGTHERVYSAIVNKSVVLTNKTHYLAELLDGNNDIIFYDPNHVQVTVEQVKKVLNLEAAQYNIITSAAFEKIKTSFTYEHRAQEIIQVISKSENDL